MASIPDLSKVPGATQGDSEPGKISGQYHSTKGTVVEVIGNVTGATSWQHAGKEEREMGDAEYNVARASEHKEDSIGGKKATVDNEVADSASQEAPAKIRQDEGENQEKLDN